MFLCEASLRPGGVYRVAIVHRTAGGEYAPGSEMHPVYRLERQPINQATSKGWQSWRKVADYDNEFKARRAWLYAGR